LPCSIGDLADPFTFGVGPTVRLELPFGDHLGIIGQASFVFLIPQSDMSEVIQSARMIPLQAGAKYYLAENQSGPYLQGLAGVHCQRLKTKDISISGGTVLGSTTSSSTFIWGLGLGIKFERLDIGGRFNIHYA